MNRYGREQFLDELLSLLLSQRRVGTGGTMGQIDQSDHRDRDIGIPALPEMAASICRAFCPSRSAVISTLESRISPMRAVRAARDDFRKLPPHPWRSQRRWSPSSLQLATRSLRDGPVRRYWCMDHRHGQLATLDHDFRTRAHPCQQPSESLAASTSDVDHMVSHPLSASSWIL